MPWVFGDQVGRGMAGYVNTVFFNDVDFPVAPLPVFDEHANCIGHGHRVIFDFGECLLGFSSAGAHGLSVGMQTRVDPQTEKRTSFVDFSLYDLNFHLVMRAQIPLRDVLPCAVPGDAPLAALQDLIHSRIGAWFSQTSADFYVLLATGLSQAVQGIIQSRSESARTSSAWNPSRAA